jgi:DNA-binding CsgD family transcriptional regulator
VGRDVELETIAAILTRVRAGQGEALVLVGPAGIGKTELLRAVRSMAAGFRVLFAQGVEQEADLPFSGLHELIHREMHELRPLPMLQYRALAGALALGPPTDADAFAIGVATLNALAVLAETQPVLVLIDDLQWLDAASRQALLFAARRLDREGVAILMAEREPAPGRTQLGIPEATLPGLGVETAGPLIKARCGVLPAAAVVSALVASTDGNPLALVEAAGRLTPGQIAGVEPLEDPLALGLGASLAFASTVNRLPPATQIALVTVAALGSVLSPELLATVLGELDLRIDDLQPAESAGVVLLGGDRPEFRHPLFRSAAYHGATPEERRCVHAAIARAGGTARLGDDWAWHLAGAAIGPDQTAAGALDALAHRHLLRHGYAAAAQAFARAAALSETVAIRLQCLVEAAQAAHDGGEYTLAEGYISEALPLADTAEIHADLRRVLARIATARGLLSVARDILVAESIRLERTDRRRAGRFLVDAAMPSLWSLELDPGVPDARQAYALEQATGPVEGAGDAVVLAMVLMGHYEEAWPGLDRWQQRVQTASAPLDEHHRALPLARALIWTGRTTAARSVLERLAHVARTQKPSELPLILEVVADLEWRAGRWDYGAAAAAEGAELAAQMSQSLALTRCLAIRARFDAARGRDDACRAAGAQVAALTHDLSSEPWTRGLIEPAVGLRALVHGEAELAVNAFAAALDVAKDRQVRNPEVVPHHGDLIEALVMAGRAGDAVPVLQALQHRATESGQGSARSIAARCRGMLAPTDGFEPHFASALDEHTRSRQPFEEARTNLLLGERLRRTRRRSDARMPLRTALAVFETLGAEPWAARTRAELRATGETVSARRAGSNELTPQELRIALAVADGATNREAAAALFLSVKTVEYHLTKVYQKLGARSRTHLARLLHEGSGDRSPPETSG